MSCIPVGAQNVCASLDQIPHREQELLKQLFSFFIHWDQLSHVLFFETKPVCFTGIPADCNHCVTPPFISKNPLKFQEELHEGWKIWKKYEHLFSHPNFLICEEKSHIGSGEKHGTMIDIFFINKKGLLSCLNKHKALFRKELGKSFTPENFLNEVEKQQVLRPLINYDEMLLGILLGYGYEASSAFRAHKLGEDTDTPMKSVGKTLKGCKFSPVSFRGDPQSEESKTFMKVYLEELGVIWTTYQENDLLEITLKKLCADSGTQQKTALFNRASH